jgi:hypothetical protein
MRKLSELEVSYQKVNAHNRRIREDFQGQVVSEIGVEGFLSFGIPA